MILTGLFLLPEIDNIVSLCDGNKSPDPDGFNHPFLKRFWSLLRDDLGEMFDQFHQHATLPRSFTSFFVTFIPKIDSPSQLGTLNAFPKWGLFL